MSDDLSRVLVAASFAAEKHRDQKRKNINASPYINHPLAVAMMLAEDGGSDDADLLIAAMLHDTIEDTETTGDEISEKFGKSVYDLVAEVTDDKSLSKQRRKQLQIENAPHKSDRAKQLKIADKTCNIRDIDASSPAGWDTDRKLDYLDWAERVVAGCRGVNHTLDRLFDNAVAEARGRLIC